MPQPTQGVINKAYVSALDPSLDKREIDATVYDIWREDQFTDILSVADRKEVVAQPFYISWTNTQLFYQVDTTGATVTGSGSNTVVTTTTTTTAGIARKGQVVYFTDGNSGVITIITTAAGKDTLTITNDNHVLTTTAGDKLGLGVIMAGERSDSPTNTRFGYTKYSNKWAIFTEVSQITDVQGAGKLEATINGNDTIMMKDHLDKLKLLKGGINFEFMMSDISATSFSDTNPTLTDPNIVTGGGGGGAMQRTRGLNKYVETYGKTLSAVGSGTSGAPVPNGLVSLTDFDNTCDALTAARAPREQMVFSNKAVRRGFDKLIKNLASAGITSSRMMINGKELDATVDKFTYGGYEWNFTTLPIQDHQNISSTVVGKSAYILPYNFRVGVYGGGEKPCLGTRYVPNQGNYGNDLIGETHSGALSVPNPNGTVQEWKTVWVSKQGFEFKSPSLGVRLQVLP